MSEDIERTDEAETTEQQGRRVTVMRILIGVCRDCRLTFPDGREREA